ncbi:lipid transferase CIDEC isoform X1 [Balaenoptera acutorostrata]|uniref:Lipid transferase CIDEC isoform X1 n=2 Tax=Balaenoptera acutorostrata TaxID=9767 RepID=A0A452CPQ7_BALAC|nr:lipid transferase CIDEC isoform X1 [Balaenoptera acutorostrata]
MEPNTVQLTRMEYAMKSLSLLYPRSLSRYVAVSTSVVAQKLLSEPSPEAPRARPCRVSSADRSVRKGIMTHSLEDLRLKVQDTLMLADKPFFLVLEEDGTTVETEEYFQSLADDTVFMVLHKGQKWQPPSEQGTRYQLSLSRKPAEKIDVARVTFDLYKVNPQDFIGCLNVKATLYGTYSLSYDLRCYGARRVMNAFSSHPEKLSAGPSSACRPQATCCSAPPVTCSSSWMPQREGSLPRAKPHPSSRPV